MSKTYSVTGIVVDIYARVSTDIQEEDGTSLETQIENCLTLATTKGYIVGKIFREVFTGSLYRERPLLSEARNRYRNGETQGLLFNAFDRLSRNQIHLGVLIDEMHHYNVIVECVQENCDTSAAGQFMQNALAFAAEVEREKILTRTNDGRRKRAKNGKMLGWHAPRYGYIWNEDRTAYVIHEQEAAIVKRIYAMALQGISIHSIASTLTQEGVPTRGNLGTRKFKGVWLRSTVHRILSSSCYIGVAVVYRTRQEKINGKRHTIYRSDEDVITLPDGVIPLIKEEQEKLLAFRKHCSIYREKLENSNATFTYQEKREALEYFGIKAFVWRVHHTPRFKIVSSGSCLVSPSPTHHVDDSRAGPHL